MNNWLCVYILLSWTNCVFSQQFPAASDNIDYLVTSSKDASKSIGDDDHQQVIFFLIPEKYDQAFYIKIFDPEISGAADEIKGTFNSTTSFTVFGGEGSHSEKKSRSVDPNGNTIGNLIERVEFGRDTKYDQKWYSLGPFNPKKGEFSSDFGGYIFKLIVSGDKGDDVNLYRLFLSAQEDNNVKIPGGNLFTYEYSFRLKSNAKTVAHVYPYIDDKVVSITQYNFDFDFDGGMFIYSLKKKGEAMRNSGDGEWKNSAHGLHYSEKNKCLDIQIIKKGNWHNDMVMYIYNQYNEAVPFLASPIGSTGPQFGFDEQK